MDYDTIEACSELHGGYARLKISCTSRKEGTMKKIVILLAVLVMLLASAGITGCASSAKDTMSESPHIVPQPAPAPAAPRMSEPNDAGFG